MKYQNVSPHDLFLSVNGKSRVVRAGEIFEASSVDQCPQLKVLSQEKPARKPVVVQSGVSEPVREEVIVLKKRKRSKKTRKVDANS